MTEFAGVLEAAVKHHRSGDLETAESLYHDVLRIDARQADALHLLGVIANERREPRRAAHYIRRAIEISPEFSGAHYNLAIALEAEGQPDEALASYQTAIRIQPGFFEARNNLGRLLSSLGRPAEAVEEFRQALVIKPRSSEVHYNLANALRKTGRDDEAVACYREAIRFNPDIAAVHNNLGTALKDRGDIDEAVLCFRRATTLNPRDPEAHNNVGAALEFQGHLDEAVRCYRHALELNFAFAGPHANLGNVFAEQNNMDEAIAQYDEAVRLDPGYAEAHYNRALAWLRAGDFRRGWPEYEWRWRRKVRPREFAQPAWDGGPLAGRTIFVYAEQGIGDEIMFASCLPEVIARSARCVIECDPRLVPLFARSFPTATSVPRLDRQIHHTHGRPSVGFGAAPQVDFEVQVAMGSLPRFLRPTLDSFIVGGRRIDRDSKRSPIAPHPDPLPKGERESRSGYLRPDPQRLQTWRQRFAALGAGMTVGISWQGGGEDDPRRRRTRSTVLDQWKPVLSLPNVAFVSLQNGRTAEELAALWNETGLVIHDWDDADPFMNLDDFAAQIAALDLVISVDNSTVHMAGALGVPVWTLLPFASDWRWLLDRDDSPWYPTMRLFRQRVAGAWNEVFARVADRLRSQDHRRGQDQRNPPPS